MHNAIVHIMTCDKKSSFKLKVENVICLNRSGPIRIFLFNVIIDTTRLKPKINLQASLAQQSQSTTYHHESGPHCPVCVVFCPTLTARTLTGNSVDSELLTAAPSQTLLPLLPLFSHTETKK